MAATGIQPFIKLLDSNGAPIVGGKLHVYEVNTTTYRAVYSDADLTTPLANPLDGANASDASGDFPKFYMAAGEYKLRAVTSADVLVWEEDDLDTGLSAGSGALAISRGGTGATTAAAARANLDVPSNSELEALSEQIADFSTSLQSVLSQPGGRLTLTSNTPILVTGVTAGTAVYYTPYASNICPVYDGTQYNLQQFAELTLTLAAQHTASNIFDCFIINDSGTIRIVTGPAWTTPTAGAGARGSGAGTTEITRLNGIWVNANAMATARNGASTYSVAANQGTYVGSLYIDGTNGQISCLTAYGQSRKWGVWNAYNRKSILMLAGDPTASWSTAPTTWRQSRADATNFITAFSGLPEEVVKASFTQTINQGYSSSDSKANIGIGVNSTTVLSGQSGLARINNTSTAGNAASTMVANHTLAPTIGINNLNMLEQAPTGTTANVFNGASTDMRMTAEWLG